MWTFERLSLICLEPEEMEKNQGFLNKLNKPRLEFR
jgi:hypothetical protein